MNYWVNSKNPNGCKHCGIDYQIHCQRYHDDVGWHGWTQPTQDQIKARMLKRRLERYERQRDH